MDPLTRPLHTRTESGVKYRFHTHEGKGRIFQKIGCQHLAWIERDEGYRFVGAAHKIIHLRHKGWYVDHHEDDTTSGVVYRLPHGRFVAGCSDPWNSEKTGKGPFLMEEDVFTDANEAALRADRIAELHSECLREDDARSEAEQQIEDAKDGIDLSRGKIRLLIQGIRQSTLAPVICEQLRQDIRHTRKEITELNGRIRTLTENFWLAVER